MPVSLYIDATSGGMVLQILLSGFVGGFVIIKLFWRNFLNTLLHRKPTVEETPTVDSSVGDPGTSAG